MNEPHDDEGFDRTPQGEALATLLRRHAPPASSAAIGAAAVLGRLQQQRRAQRLGLMRWLAPAAGVAAAILIVLVATLPDEARAPAPQPGVPALATPEPQPVPQSPQAVLTARLRGTSGNGWRLDAGLKDGLRVGDKLVGKSGATAEVVAAGIFDSRVRVDGPAARGAEFAMTGVPPRVDRALRMVEYGGDPGALLDLGAILDTMPMREARLVGLADGRAVQVQEVIPAVLRDFAGEPQSTLAARLGLRAGDVVVAVNGMQVRDVAGMANALEYSRGGNTSVTVIRGSATLELSAK
ncbi:MAG: PDZ domain-containing protein [Planctomycetes bacterium]|nr:PDZ domain-containing protein [Planctomycetota bacterium]